MDALTQYKKIAGDEIRKLHREIERLRVAKEILDYDLKVFREQKKLSDDEVVQEFVRRFYKRVSTWDQEAQWYIRYDPKKDSRAFTVRGQHGFTVIYSVATVNDYNTAIASYWLKEKGKPRFEHLDLTSLVSAILKHYELKYYDPITQQEK